MERIFHHDDTMYEAATKVFVSTKSNDTYAYSDEACTQKINTETLTDLYVRGMIIVASGVMYKPVSLSVSSNVATVTYVTTDSTTATTAKLATIKSVAE